MSTAVEVLSCAGCGSPLAPGAMKCEFCGNQNLVKSRPAQIKITSELANKYIAHFSEKAKENPKDSNALYGMGVMYLQLKNYELAERNLKEAIDQSPLDSDVYYYYSLSLLAGKSIKTMDGAVIERLEQYLGTAMNMQAKCKYIALTAAIKEEYYQQNNLIVRGKSPAELFEEAKGYVPEELEEITEHCAFSGPNTGRNINMLMGKESDAADGGADADGHLSIEQRQSYFAHRFEPGEPRLQTGGEKGDYYLRREKSYLGKIALKLGALLPALILSAIILAIGGYSEIGFKYTETPLRPLSSVAQMAILEKARADQIKKDKTKKIKPYTAKERSERILKFKLDSIAKAKEYKTYGDGKMRLYTSYSRAGGYLTSENVLWLENSVTGYVAAAAVFAPIAFWIFGLIGNFTYIWNSNRIIRGQNNALWSSYLGSMEAYRRKPSAGQMAAFINKYLSELIDNEIKGRGKSENDFIGKTLFLSRWNSSYDKRQSDDFIASRKIDYCIFLLEKNGVSYIESCWDIAKDFSIDSNLTSIPYSKISSVSCGKGTFAFGDKYFDINYQEPLFQYQSDDSSKLTFSNSRISNVHLFAQALEKLASDRNG